MSLNDNEGLGRARQSSTFNKNAEFCAPPLVPEVGVLALVPDQWHWQWQVRHQVMSRLARYFTVVWMSPAEDWRHSLRSLNLWTQSEETPLSSGSFVVHTPSSLLPLVYRPAWLAQTLLRKRLKRARGVLSNLGCKQIVLYLWRPDFAKAIDILSSDLICYHVDDEYSFSAEEHPISEQETHLLTRADQVFIHSPALLEKKGQMNRNTAFVPNGVDYEHYSKRLPEPADIASLPHPRIGYSGRIKRQLDWVLVRELVARHPQWFFVFVGAINPHPEVASYIHDLTRRPNIRFLGSKSTQELAAYPQYFDVCIMPYIRDDYTKYIYPLKLHEYLATGRPVVSTPIPSLQEFSDVVLLPQNAEEWSSAIAESLSPAANLPNQEIKRQKIARGHDWEILVRRIAEIISTRLGPEVSRRLNQSSGVEESRAIRKS